MVRKARRRVADLPPLDGRQGELAARNYGLAKHITRKMCLLAPGRFDDYWDGAIIALCWAARDFDPSHGAKFSVFAGKYIKRAIMERAKHHGRAKRSAAIESIDASPRFLHPVVWPRLADGEPDFEGRIAILADDRFRDILRLRFVEGLTLQEAGDRLGCTREWIRRLEFRALAELHSAMTAG